MPDRRPCVTSFRRCVRPGPSVTFAGIVAAVVLGLSLATSPLAHGQCAPVTPVTSSSCAAAKQYNLQTGGVSLLVWVDGQTVCEDYTVGSGATIPHELWSCTKSFSSIMAARAIQDGLISSWDEKLVGTIPEWEGDPRKSQITLRHLLSLTSGIDASGEPLYADSILAPTVADPGTFYEYGSTPYQIFGEFMRRKLAPNYPDPLAYVQAKIFTPLTAVYAGWNRDSDTMPHLPWGSQWVPRQWVKYGEFVRLGGYSTPSGEQILDQELMDGSFHSSPVNSTYGLTWWLPTPGSILKPCDTVMAFGLGTQKLYVIRSLGLVAIRQTDDAWDGLTFSDDVFLDRLLAPSNPQDDCPPVAASQLTLARSGSDVLFDWSPVHRDVAGKVELLAGYDVLTSSQPDFAGSALLQATKGATSATSVPGEASAASPITYYRVRARDKCGNLGP